MLVRLDYREALKQFISTFYTDPCSPHRGQHTICTAQRASKLPQLEVTLQMFSADLVTHPLRNPLLKDILVYLGRDIEILHHCTLQTPALACSLGYFDNPALFRNPLGNSFQKDTCTSAETSRCCSTVRRGEMRFWEAREEKEGGGGV